MIVSADLMNLLRCPRTGQKLSLADADLIARVNAHMSTPKEELPEDKGISRAQNITAAVISVDQTTVYPVCDGIPVLLPEEAILLRSNFADAIPR